MYIILMGVLVVGILLGALIISLSFLAQESEENKEGTEILILCAADSYHRSSLGVMGNVNQAAQYHIRP
jgi:hypothetical protein